MAHESHMPLLNSEKLFEGLWKKDELEFGARLLMDKIIVQVINC